MKIIMANFFLVSGVIAWIIIIFCICYLIFDDLYEKAVNFDDNRQLAKQIRVLFGLLDKNDYYRLADSLYKAEDKQPNGEPAYISRLAMRQCMKNLYDIYQEQLKWERENNGKTND